MQVGDPGSSLDRRHLGHQSENSGSQNLWRDYAACCALTDLEVSDLTGASHAHFNLSTSNMKIARAILSCTCSCSRRGKGSGCGGGGVLKCCPLLSTPYAGFTFRNTPLCGCQLPSSLCACVLFCRIFRSTVAGIAVSQAGLLLLSCCWPHRGRSFQLTSWRLTAGQVVSYGASVAHERVSIAVTEASGPHSLPRSNHLRRRHPRHAQV